MKLSDFRHGKTTLRSCICNACYTLRPSTEIRVLYVGLIREYEIDLPLHYCRFSRSCRKKILEKATRIYEDRARRLALIRFGAFNIR